MKFTVIGARGYIGSAMVRYLRERGGEVCTPERGSLPEGNLGRVIYAAGATRDFLADPAYTLRAHVTNFSNLLEKEFDHCWYLSSVRLYDYTGLEEVDESTPIKINSDNPRSVFDATKVCGESIALHAAKGKVSVARLACVYGGDLTSAAFLHELIAKVRSGNPESGSNRNMQRDYIHIDDVCRALAEVEAPSGIVNICSGKNISNAMLFEAVEHAANHRFACLNTMLPPPPRIRNEKFLSSFAFQPRGVIEWLTKELSEP